jgi:hypothetical protein
VIRRSVGSSATAVTVDVLSTIPVNMVTIIAWHAICET